MSKKYPLITLVFFLLTSVLLSACGSKVTTLEGYLIDKHCFEMKKDDPSKDTKKCLEMDKCDGSGYGIAVKQSDGKYKFYKFDENGHKSAKEILSKTTKKDKDNIVIVVKGTQEDDSIKISSISEK